MRTKQALIILLLCGVHLLKAQVPGSKILSLPDATALAKSNNVLIKVQQLRIREADLLVSTAKALPKTGFSTEIGQLNTRALDFKFGVSQSFKHPDYYKAQEQLRKAEAEAVLPYTKLTEKELKNQVTRCFYRLVYLQNYKQSLLQFDSLYQIHLTNTTKQVKLGEATAIEQLSAEALVNENKNLLEQLKLVTYEAQTEWKYYLQSDAWYLPPTNTPLPSLDTTQTWESIWQNHPELAIQTSNNRVLEANTKATKTGMLPEFTAGYTLQSITGTHSFAGTDYEYNKLPQFSVFQLGMQLPISSKSYKKQVEASQLKQQINEQLTSVRGLQLKKDWELSKIAFLRAKANLEYQKSTLLTQSNRLVTIAERSRKLGEIGHSEWMTYTLQAYKLQQSYLAALEEYLNTYQIAISF